MFSITRNQGFQIKFPNGLTVSVQFGPNHYCDNRVGAYVGQSDAAYVTCANAEVAVLRKRGFVTGWPHWKEGDDVMGWLTPNQVADIIAWAAAQHP